MIGVVAPDRAADGTDRVRREPAIVRAHQGSAAGRAGAGPPRCGRAPAAEGTARAVWNLPGEVNRGHRGDAAAVGSKPSPVRNLPGAGVAR